MSRKKKKDEVALLTADEAAGRLRVKVRQLHKMRRAGLVAGVKLGHRTIMYEEPEIEALVQRRRQNGSTRTQRALFSAEDPAMPARF